MVGGQHRSDEVTRTERVGWTRIGDRRRNRLRLGKGRAPHACWCAQWEEAKTQKRKKDEETS
jgi:hypothetical protein